MAVFGRIKKKSAGEEIIPGPTKKMRVKAGIVIALLFVGFFMTCKELVGIQVVQAEALRKKAVEQQMKDVILTPKRGNIYDAKMSLLAQSGSVWKLLLSPRDLLKSDGTMDEEKRALVINGLCENLGLNRDTLDNRTQRTYSQYEVLKTKIDHPTMKTLTKWIQENKLTRVLWLVEDLKRYYPNNNLLSSVIGFTGAENTGLYGLEAYYNSTLAGKAGRVITAKNGVGDDMSIKMKYERTINAENGKNLVLTIDSVVQYYAEKYLEQAVKEANCYNRGCAIVMEVDTGAIIAMATKGDFDPNDYQKVTDPAAIAAIAALSGDEQAAKISEAQQKQWSNKAVQDFYEPGSVFKVFTSATGLEEKIITAESSFSCSGSYQVIPGTKPISCHRHSGHGSQLFPKALSNSCNPAFMKIGGMIGRSLFYKYYTAFGFTERTGVDMLSESRVTSALFHSEAALNPIELATAAFGQRNKVTPIQMIAAMSSVANGGYLLQPYVVGQILNDDMTVHSTTERTVKRQVISEQVSSQLSLMLGEVATSGGAINAYIPGYRMAGKTGTSQKLDVGEGKDVVASFSGFAPYDDPKYAILVMLDEPHPVDGIRYGGTLAAPVAQKIMSEALPHLGVEPKYTEKELASMERKTPDVRDKEVGTATNMLKSSDLTYKIVGDGTKVLSQIPAAGQTIPKNGIVVLYTSKSAANTKTTVPDFSGKTLSQANIAAAAANINLQITGIIPDSAEAKGATQTIAAGTSVSPGTVVKVSFVYHDEIA